MSSLSIVEQDVLSEISTAVESDQVKRQVDSILAGLTARSTRIECRRNQRYPFPFLIQLRPFRKDGMAAEDEPIIVVGKNLSVRGIGFYHQQPISYRKAIVDLEGAAGHRVSLLVELTWCRFTCQGWYDSGGRILGVTTDTVEQPHEPCAAHIA